MITSQRVNRGFHRLAIFLVGSTCALGMSALMLTAPPAKPDEAKARLSQVMYTAFECATFAAIAEQSKEVQRLTDLGLKAGREFTDALTSGAISKEEMQTVVPLMTGLMARAESQAQTFLWVEYMKKLTSRHLRQSYKRMTVVSTLDVKDWVMDDELQKLKAQNLYQKSNCELIR